MRRIAFHKRRFTQTFQWLDKTRTFEFNEDQIEMQDGILKLVFQVSPVIRRVVRLPRTPRDVQPVQSFSASLASSAISA